jgi:2-polyprenyl-3-methyl-5-hydroxy-6-metoxy-1,4-benzoquinol methylase
MAMNAALVQQLVQINRDFYSRFSSSFAESRSLAQPSLRRLLTYLLPAARVLDVGCGHGRIAHLLDRNRPGARYLGLDFSAELVLLAREGAATIANISVDFKVADVTQPGWSGVLAHRHFDTILLLAVLHHIPAFENRAALLRTLRQHLAPGGRLIISAWQFTTNERMRRKIVPWDRVGLDLTGLETGDHLLDWKRGGLGYRYCHLIDEDELARLAAESGLKELESWRADGKEGDLSLFGLLVAEDLDE